jgi:putative flippase GtrA
LSQLLRFAVVGTIGFLVDSGTLLLAVRTLDWQPLPGRVASFLVAATVTYLLNRRFTFPTGGTGRFAQWLRYLLVTLLGAFINLGVYSLWLRGFGAAPLQLLFGTAAGSVAALAANFYATRALVFRSQAA